MEESIIKDYYMVKPMQLIKAIDDKLNEVDSDFMKKFKDYLKNIINNYDLGAYQRFLFDKFMQACELSNGNLRSPLFDEVDINNDNVVVGLLKSLLFNYSYDSDGKYKRIHSARTPLINDNLSRIIDFIIKYDKEYYGLYGTPGFPFLGPNSGKRKVMVIPNQTRMKLF